VPPKRENRRRKPKAAGKAKSEDEASETKEKPASDKPKGRRHGSKAKKAAGAAAGGGRQPPFHSVISEDVKTAVSARGLALVRNTVDFAMDGGRIKLGQGGYASLVEAAGVIGEGTFTCDADANVVFTWERCLKFADGKWESAAPLGLLPASLCMTDGKDRRD
jgi:hypothetical protein